MPSFRLCSLQTPMGVYWVFYGKCENLEFKMYASGGLWTHFAVSKHSLTWCLVKCNQPYLDLSYKNAFAEPDPGQTPMGVYWVFYGKCENLEFKMYASGGLWTHFAVSKHSLTWCLVKCNQPYLDLSYKNAFAEPDPGHIDKVNAGITSTFLNTRLHLVQKVA